MAAPIFNANSTLDLWRKGHAQITIAARAFDKLGWPRTDILGFIMPGFATGDETKGYALSLMRDLGITAGEIDIKLLALQLLQDLKHPFGGCGRCGMHNQSFASQHTESNLDATVNQVLECSNHGNTFAGTRYIVGRFP